MFLTNRIPQADQQCLRLLQIQTPPPLGLNNTIALDATNTANTTHAPSGRNIALAVSIIIAIMLLLTIVLLPSNKMISLYDRIQRGFKPAPSDIRQLSFTPNKPQKTYTQRIREEDEQKKRAEEEKSKTFLQRHLNTLRNWKKPKKQEKPWPKPLSTIAEEPEVAVKILNGGRPDVRYGRSYAGFEQWMKDQDKNKGSKS